MTENIKIKYLIKSINTGLNPRKNFVLNRGNNFYVTTKNIDGRNIILDEKCDNIDDLALRRINARSDLRKDDILFSGIGTIGRTAYITETPKNWNISESLYSIRVNDRILPGFMFYVLNTHKMEDYESHYQTGSAQKGLRIEDLKNFSFNLPDLIKQKPIVDFLDAKCKTIDRLIINEEKSIESLKIFKQRTIDDACQNPSFKKIKIKYVTSILRGGSPRPIDDYITEEDGSLNWIKIGDGEKGTKYISSCSEKIKKTGLSKTRLIKSGNIILSNSMSFGQPYILKIDGCIHDGWLAFTETKVKSDYLFYSLCTSNIIKQFKRTAEGGVVQNLNINKVGSSVIFVPNENKQDEITFFLDKKCLKIDNLIKLKEKKIELLKSYKKSLIYEYVTGKKEVPYAN